ncbi:MAG: hypothetical protein WBO34_03090 [Gammaproteobacteria bacterium]
MHTAIAIDAQQGHWIRLLQDVVNHVVFDNGVGGGGREVEHGQQSRCLVIRGMHRQEGAQHQEQGGQDRWC